MDKRGFGYDWFSDKITTHGRSHLSLLRESYQKNDLRRKITAVVSIIADFCHLCFFAKSCHERTVYLHALLSSSSLCQIFVLLKLFASLSSTLILLLLHLPLTSFHLYQIIFLSNQEPYHTFLSSLLGPSMDLGLSSSLYISFLRISATCCVSWTNRLFGKASPINEFGVSLPTIV